jgi:hypothetical protein
VKAARVSPNSGDRYSACPLDQNVLMEPPGVEGALVGYIMGRCG